MVEAHNGLTFQPFIIYSSRFTYVRLWAKSEISNVYFMKNDYGIMVKYRWGYSSAAGSWRSPDGGLGSKSQKKCWPFKIWDPDK